MSITDLQNYIVHANDTFVQVSSYQLNKLLGKLHNQAHHLDVSKAAFADMWYTLKQGKLWSGIVKNRRKNGDYYQVRANVVPMVREGRVIRYMSIRIRTTDEKITAIEPLYKVLNEGRCNRCIHKRLVARKDWLGKLPMVPVRWWVCSVTAFMFVLLAVVLQQVGVEWPLLPTSALAILSGTATFEWQIVCPIEDVTRQAPRVATGERNSVSHFNRSDKLGSVL